MSDALKSLPASPTFAIAATGNSAVPTASAATAGLPPAFANLTAGTVIAGIVIERGRGTIMLKTDNGLLKLATSLAVRLGAELTLEVQSVGAQVRFAVVAVDQHAPSASESGFAAQGTVAKATLPELNELADGKVADRTTVIGRLVTATIVAPPESGGRTIGASTIATLLGRVANLSAAVGNAGAASSNGAIAQTLPILPGTDALEKVLAAIGPLPAEIVEALLNEPVSLPLAATEQSVEVESQPQAQAQNKEAATSPAAVENDGDALAAMANRQITIRLLDVLAPAMAGNRPLPLRPAETRNDSITLAGNVVSNDGKAIEIATALGKLRLPMALDIETGSQIAFEIVAQDNREPGLGPQATSTVPSLPSRTIASEPARDWPALRDLATALQTVDPSVTETLLPKAGMALGPSLLAFLAGMRSGGNARAWLGKAAVDALDATTRDRLIERLTAELSTEAKVSAITDKTGWQTVAVPVLDGERLNEIRFHFQKRRQGKGSKDESQGNRFVIETNLSALGPLQLDGLVRMKRFDLIVRTSRPMPDAMQRDIETLFTRTLSESDYLGGVSFRGDMAQGPATAATTPRSAGVLA